MMISKVISSGIILLAVACLPAAVTANFLFEYAPHNRPHLPR